MTFNGFPTTINVVQNDYGYNLQFTLQDSTGAVVDLTNATSVKFNAQFSGADTIQFDNAMIVTSAAAGQCKYVVQQTDFVVAGTWAAMIVVTYAGEVISFPGITVNVTAALPIS